MAEPAPSVTGADRTPRPLLWLGSAAVVGALSVPPAGAVGGLLGDALRGGIRALFELVIAGSLLVFSPIAVRKAAGGLLGFAPRKARRVTAIVVVLGLLPWFLEAAVHLSSTDRWQLYWPGWVLHTVVFTLVAAAVALQDVTRAVAVATVAALTAAAWLPMRHALVADLADSAVHRLGDPPRSLLRVVSWSDYSSSDYTYSAGVVTRVLDPVTALPVSDDVTAYLLVSKVNGSTPCDAPFPHGGGDGNLEAKPCTPAGGGVWVRGDCEALTLDQGVAVQVIDDQCPGSRQLVEVLRSQRPATDAEILALT